jgi:hypothetical protein
MRYVHIQHLPLDIEADHLRHHIQGSIVPVGGLDYGISCQQGLSVDQG